MVGKFEFKTKADAIRRAVREGTGDTTPEEVRVVASKLFGEEITISSVYNIMSVSKKKNRVLKVSSNGHVAKGYPSKHLLAAREVLLAREEVTELEKSIKNEVFGGDGRKLRYALMMVEKLAS